MTLGIHHLPIEDTPVAILDFETTGFSPKAGARVVEVAVVRIEPGQQPRLVLDTLVDPEGPVLASSIHGIEDADVLGAPTFPQVAGPIAHALRGAVVGIFNASFDTQFLAHETQRHARLRAFAMPPYACLMYMRPALGLGARCCLETALWEEELPAPDHRAAHDALASGHLWQRYSARALASGVRTFGDLAKRKRYKFMDSWSGSLIDERAAAAMGAAECAVALLPRMTPLAYSTDPRVPRSAGTARSASTHAWTPESGKASYMHALSAILSDGQVDDDEIHELESLRSNLGLTRGSARAVHAHYFSQVLAVAMEDDFVSHDETDRIALIHGALRRLGWAPGDLSTNPTSLAT